MQDPTLYGQMNPQFPEQEHLKCPRCDSSNTKFCYYNNYNLSQPRHYCKNCRRYWTKGGALRNIPVGGGSRKNAKRTSTKRSSATSSLSPSSVTEKAAAVAATSSSSSPPPPTSQILAKPEPNGPPSSFSSLLASNLGQYGPNLQLYGFLNQGHGPSQTQDSGQNPGQNGSRNNNGSNCDGFLSVQNGEDSSSFWNGGSNGWPDLSIYTPGGSSFH